MEQMKQMKISGIDLFTYAISINDNIDKKDWERCHVILSAAESCAKLMKMACDELQKEKEGKKNGRTQQA